MRDSCEICGNAEGNAVHVVREMMFGLRESFRYLECGACGCLQNVTVPDDLGRYYGQSYYSVASGQRELRPVRDRLKRWRTRAYVEGGGLLDRLLLTAFGPPGLPDWVKRAGVRQDSALLEVGCGSGDLLQALRSEGFTNLTGADPFIEQEIDYGGGLRILKAHINEVPGRYDFVVLEHAFEHIPDQQATLHALAALLKPGGMLIIAIPLVGEAWRRYGVCWVQLDAPRHLFLHTERSFLSLCSGLEVEDVVFDSGAMQFWGSEQYLSDIPLMDSRSYAVNAGGSVFSPRQIEDFNRQAAQLNASRQGDQASFYLRFPARD